MTKPTVTPLGQAISVTSHGMIIEMVLSLIGNKLFAAVAAANASEETRAQAKKDLDEIFDEEFFNYLPEKNQVEMRALYKDAIELLEMDTK